MHYPPISAPKGESPKTLALMPRIDELFLKYPFYGARQIVRYLRREGVRLGRLMGFRRSIGRREPVIRIPSTESTHICSEV